MTRKCPRADQAPSGVNLLRFYDRAGRMIREDEWWALRVDGAYRWLAFDEVAPGLEVSTIWEGMGYPDGPWQIYATAVWEGNAEVAYIPYRTKAEALDGHVQAVAWARARHGPDRRLPPLPPPATLLGFHCS